MKTNQVLLDHLSEMRRLSKRHVKPSVLIQQFFPRVSDSAIRMPAPTVTGDCVLNTVEVNDISDLESSFESLNESVDILFCDVDDGKKFGGTAMASLQKSLPKLEILPYSERRLWVSAIAQTLVHLRAKKKAGLDYSVLLAGKGKLVSSLFVQLIELGFQCDVINSDIEPGHWMKEFQLDWNRPKTKTFDVLVGCDPQTTALDEENLVKLHSGGAILDGGIGAVSAKAIAAAIAKNIDVFRLDIRAAAEGFVRAQLVSREVFNKHMGRDIVAGIPVIACGIMGRNGDIVLDSISAPKLIFGVADGAGRMKTTHTAAEVKSIERINELIQRQV